MLLEAKQALKLKQLINKFDRYEVLIIDDISYIPYSDPICQTKKNWLIRFLLKLSSKKDKFFFGATS